MVFWGNLGLGGSKDFSRPLSGGLWPTLTLSSPGLSEEEEWGRVRGWEEADRRVGTVHRVRKALRSCPAHGNARL